MCHPVPPNLQPGDPMDLRRSQESQGVTVPLRSSHITHSRCLSGPHVPSGSAAEFRLSTATTLRDRVCATTPS